MKKTNLPDSDLELRLRMLDAVSALVDSIPEAVVGEMLFVGGEATNIIGYEKSDGSVEPLFILVNEPVKNMWGFNDGVPVTRRPSPPKEQQN